MTTEQKLKKFIGNRINWRSKVHFVKSAKQINSKYLFITDSKTMNLDEESALNLISTAQILN